MSKHHLVYLTESRRLEGGNSSSDLREDRLSPGNPESPPSISDVDCIADVASTDPEGGTISDEVI